MIARAAAAAAALLGLLAAVLAAPLPAAAAGGSVRAFFVHVAEAPGSAATIPIDVSLYTPAVTPAPAVLLAHGFGQTKADLAPEARRLQAKARDAMAEDDFGLEDVVEGLPEADACVHLLSVQAWRVV